jgi:hypothetical protein
MSPIFSAQFSIGTVPSLVVTDQASAQVVYVHNEETSQGHKVYLGGSAGVSITTGHHLAPAGDLTLTLGPQDQLWAVADANSRKITLLNVRQD